MTHNFSPKFCILMNAFNSSDTIAESISSALAQSYSNFELLIWDNCSSDNTPILYALSLTLELTI